MVYGEMIVAAVKSLLGAPAYSVRVTGSSSTTLLLIKFSANVHPSRQQVMAQLFGSVPPMWETYPKFYACGSTWLGLSYGSLLGNELAYEKYFSLCLSNI